MSKPWQDEEKRRKRAEDKEREGFVPPESIEQAVDGIECLKGEIAILKEDLREHRRKSGEEGPTHASLAWRSRARYALDRKTACLALLREWVDQERTRIRAGTVDPAELDLSDPKGLSRAAFMLVREWARQRARVLPEEWKVINALERFSLSR